MRRTFLPGLLFISPLLPAALTGGCASTAREQSPANPWKQSSAQLADTLRPRLAAIHNDAGVPALAFGGQRGDQRIVQVFGVDAVNGGGRVTGDDPFHIGSCTKAMTATLCALLVREGKLRWDVTVAQGLPAIADDIDPRYRNVTLRELLYHRAGLPEDRKPNATFLQIMMMGRPTVTKRLEAARLILQQEPAAKPGEKFIYSNMGYVVAAAFAEQTAGKLWEELMRTRIFEPLGMTTAGFGAPRAENAPRGHRGRRGSYAPVAPGPLADNPPILGPAGRVHCSLPDWLKFARAHLPDGPLLTNDERSTLHADLYSQNYAMGWGVRDDRTRRGLTLQHAGSNTMWYAVIKLSPQIDAAFVAATNAADPAAQAACTNAMRIATEVLLEAR